jgi:glycosyltransferase involved in cell wall biosynthesis
MPTVAFFCPVWPTSIASSGIASYVETMVTAMPHGGWKSVVVAPQHQLGGSDKDENVTVFPIEQRSWMDRLGQKLFRRGPDAAVLIGRTFKKLVQHHPIDLIEIEESFGFATHVIKSVTTPVIVRLHGPWFLTGASTKNFQPDAYLRRVTEEGEAIRRAAGVTAPSQFVLDATREFYDLPLPNALVVPNPASLPSICCETLETQIPPTSPVILYVGRFEPLKGGDLAIEAFAALADGNPDAHFVFVGTDCGLQSALQCDAATYAAKHFAPHALHRFHFLGRQKPNVVSAWRSRATVVTITSRFENFPMALLEAMSQSCPVVATAVGGIPEIVQNEVNGLLVSPQSEDIANAVQRLLDSPALATQMARQASIDAAARYGVEKVVSQTYNYYDSILKVTS